MSLVACPKEDTSADKARWGPRAVGCKPLMAWLPQSPSPPGLLVDQGLGAPHTVASHQSGRRLPAPGVAGIRAGWLPASLAPWGPLAPAGLGGSGLDLLQRLLDFAGPAPLSKNPSEPAGREGLGGVDGASMAQQVGLGGRQRGLSLCAKLSLGCLEMNFQGPQALVLGAGSPNRASVWCPQTLPLQGALLRVPPCWALQPEWAL